MEVVLINVDCVPSLFSTPPMRAEHDLPFRIEVWDDSDSRVDELIALVGDHAVAQVAFAEAVRRRPGKLVTLRQKSRVLDESRGKLRDI